MLDQRRVATQADAKREQLFTERYERLLAWALRLTNQQRESAEDLVQDAFVQFMLGRTRLEEIENIDGYLRKMLRYMHVSRLSRSAQQLHETALSVAEYDSGRLGWTAIEPPRRMQASEELYQICTYACSRKESSRAGSVLILRFFHDYFPTEIAGILNSSRHCVDQWQRLARREVKLFMNEPGRLRFVDSQTAPDRQQIKYLRSDGDLMLGLRQMIFDSCKSECLSRQELEEVYANGNTVELTTATLAHIVSCPKCLDVVNGLLGLPLLAERYQAEPYNPKEPPRNATGGGGAGGGPGDLTKKFGHRLRETREHKPHELRIAVNGFVVSCLKVSSELSELNLNLTADDPIEFVEVCSEQGLQLLFFSVDPLGQDEQWAWVELSEERSLEVCFKDDNGPSLHVVYKDPVPEETFVIDETANTNGLSSPLFVVPAVIESSEPNVAARRVRFRLPSWIRKLPGLLRRGIVADEATQSAADTLVRSYEEGQFVTLLGQSKRADRKESWGFLVFVVSLSAFVIAAFLFFKASLLPEMTAALLLERASLAEQSVYKTPDKVKHRVIRLEERRSAEGAVVAQRKIEIWENRASGKRSQRLYDDSNKLIAGAWEQPDGSRTVYHHGSKPRPESALTSPHNLLLNFEDVWQLEPSAEIFGALISEPAAARVAETSTTYLLTYDKARSIGANLLLKATLTLSKSNFHAIEQTLLVQRGNESREYRFVVASEELLPLKAVAPAALEIEPELTGGAGELGRPGGWALRDLTAARVPPPSTSTPPPVASAELEVDVAYLLDLAKADRNEQVALTRSAGGSLRVEGVVDTQQRKDEFLKTLGPVTNNPAVKIAIRTVAEATPRATAIASVSVQEMEETASTVAAHTELRDYFAKRNPAGTIDEAIRAYSSRVVNRAYRALFHAIELKRLVARFAGVDMRTIAPDARAKWLTMLRKHATAFAGENTVLMQEIQPVFFAATPSQDWENVSIQSDADLARVAERLHKSALSNNDAIRSAFTITQQSSAVAVKSATFWQSIQRAQNLANEITRYQNATN